MATDDDAADGARSGEAGERSRQPCGQRKGGIIVAERSNLSNKLKLVVSYRDADDNEKTRQITFKNLKGNADATAVYGAAEALAGLQEDALIRISEVTENVIEG